MEYLERIKEIDKNIEHLEEEKRELMREHQGLFIGVRYIGDGNYWDEYFVNLGFTTEENAKEWAEENGCEFSNAPTYFEVSYEEEKIFESWYRIHRAIKDLTYIEYDVSELKEKEKKIMDDVKYLNFPSFQHISDWENE